MDVSPYNELKEDVAALVCETESYGNGLDGSFGRAFVEYWLSFDVLEKTYPTPRAMKLMAIVAICKHMEERGLSADDDDKKSVRWLVENLSAEELNREYSRADVDSMLRDAATCLAGATARLIEKKFSVYRA